MHQPQCAPACQSTPRAQVPLLAFFGLVHFGIARTGLVLGGRRGFDDRRIHHRSFSEQQAFVGQMHIDCGNDALGQFVRFEQAAELEQGGGVGRRLVGEVNTASRESPDCRRGRLPSPRRTSQSTVGR